MRGLFELSNSVLLSPSVQTGVEGICNCPPCLLGVRRLETQPATADGPAAPAAQATEWVQPYHHDSLKLFFHKLLKKMEIRLRENE